MCARYTMATSTDQIAAEFEAQMSTGEEEVSPHYNLAPTQSAPIVVETRDGERQVRLARFGLVPFWADSLKVGNRFLNARIETVGTTRAYRDALVRHRCLVVADGFYEWRREGKRKIPVYFQLPGAKPFGMAGLWAAWKNEKDEWITSFTILTMPAEGVVAKVHDRMPILVPRGVYTAWLSRDLSDAESAKALLKEQRVAELEHWDVSTRVNDVHNDDETLCQPAEDKQGTLLLP